LILIAALKRCAIQKLGGLHARKRAFSRRMCFPEAEWHLIPAAVLFAGDAEEEGVGAVARESTTPGALSVRAVSRSAGA